MHRNPVPELGGLCSEPIPSPMTERQKVRESGELLLIDSDRLLSAINLSWIWPQECEQNIDIWRFCLINPSNPTQPL